MPINVLRSCFFFFFFFLCATGLVGDSKCTDDERCDDGPFALVEWLHRPVVLAVVELGVKL